jgi:non-ribosomal peptide synthetase component F
MLIIRIVKLGRDFLGCRDHNLTHLLYVFRLKAQVRHKNFTECMHSLIHIDTFNRNDTIVQMSRCSFDIHVQEILGTLMSGAALVMLHPKGNIDFEYLFRVLEKKQITYIHTVPSLLHNFFTFAQEFNNREALKYLRSLCSSGRSLTNEYYSLSDCLFYIFR